MEIVDFSNILKSVKISLVFIKDMVETGRRGKPNISGIWFTRIQIRGKIEYLDGGKWYPVIICAILYLV